MKDNKTLNEIKKKLNSIRPENLIDKKKYEAAREKEREMLEKACEETANNE